MSGAAALVESTPRDARPARRQLSPQVAAQLAKLEELRDRDSLLLLLRAIRENEEGRK